MKEGRSVYSLTSFICKSNHLTRLYVWNNVESIDCDVKNCKLKAYRFISYRSRDAQAFKPTLIAYNPKTKEYRTIASEKSRLPKGYERVELRTSKQVRDACKFFDKQSMAEHETRVVREQMGAAGYDDPYRDYKPQTAFGERLMAYAEEHAKNSYTPKFEASNFVEAFEYDSSNLDRD